ncbi:hypothetical protein DCAR_0207109 [Daucus carota subsp. sativus]|uniref:Uncharacterized protein n=1 Tax=Daucus carota subsp. sativus TaxID=79200 RepID=A0AAF0WDB7_DAUCS|nr:hypothetical protein DCAR_0207109 [Daucus carota subsp. sativus]
MDRVGLQVRNIFMSEQATLFCSSFGLLGGYCPSTRIKDKVGCMHVEPLQGYNRNCEGVSIVSWVL